MRRIIDELELVKKNKCSDFDMFRARRMLIISQTDNAYQFQSIPSSKNDAIIQIWISKKMFDADYKNLSNSSILDVFSRKILLQEKNAFLLDVEENEVEDEEEEIKPKIWQSSNLNETQQMQFLEEDSKKLLTDWMNLINNRSVDLLHIICEKSYEQMRDSIITEVEANIDEIVKDRINLITHNAMKTIVNSIYVKEIDVDELPIIKDRDNIQMQTFYNNNESQKLNFL
jgi:hypothetical protein